MARGISNSDDIIDSRDVIARIEELTDERNALKDAVDELNTTLEMDEEEHADETTTLTALDEAKEELADWLDDYGDELKALEALAEEGENAASDWRHGETMIRESYFTEYCQEMVSDIDDMPREIPSYIVIDWDATADNLRVDYTEVDYDGVTYLIR